MIALIVILIASDLFIGICGNYLGTDAESFEEYINDPDTLTELIIVLFIAIGTVLVIHFGFKI